MSQRTTRSRSIKATLAAAAIATAVLAPGSAAAATATVIEAGSTTVFPALQTARPGWLALPKSSGISLTLGTQGSGGGLTALGAKSVQLAASSRPLTTAERADRWAWLIGGDAMVFEVSDNPAMNFISQITPTQVQGIWNGSITAWNQGGLGGPATPIFVDCRIVGSGSRDDLLRLFAVTAAQETAPGVCDSRLQTSADEAAAAATDFHIVYTSLANLNASGTKVLSLSGGAPLSIGSASTFVNPSVQTVANGTYPAPRELFLAVNKFSELPANTNTDNTAYVKAYDFINYMASQAGQNAVAASGFVPVSPFVPFPNSDVNLDGTVALGDLGKVTGRWAQSDSTPGWVRADADTNGTIALGDIGAVTGKWGASGAPNAFVAPN